MLDGSVRWRLVDVEAEEAAAATPSTPRGGVARTFSSRGLADDLSRCLVAFEYATPPLPRDDAAAPEGWDDRLASWRRLAQRALLEAALGAVAAAACAGLSSSVVVDLAGGRDRGDGGPEVTWY